MPDYPGLGRTIPDYPGQERAETGRKHPENPASIRGQTLQAVENTRLTETPAARAHRPDRSRAAISRSCRAPSAASANDAGSRAARKADHGPRDNFRPLAEHGRPRAWRGWGFRAGGAARARAPGSPREKISRDNFAAPASRSGHRRRRAGARAAAVFSPPPWKGGGEKTQEGKRLERGRRRPLRTARRGSARRRTRCCRCRPSRSSPNPAAPHRHRGRTRRPRRRAWSSPAPSPPAPYPKPASSSSS